MNGRKSNWYKSKGWSNLSLMHGWHIFFARIHLVVLSHWTIAWLFASEPSISQCKKNSTLSPLYLKSAIYCSACQIDILSGNICPQFSTEMESGGQTKANFPFGSIVFALQSPKNGVWKFRPTFNAPHEQLWPVQSPRWNCVSFPKSPLHDGLPPTLTQSFRKAKM